jgi:1-aminocyclopropane-1-carboxylate deaminase/D-cysteine desulfhydrase-like pyridoxal-dependent ACC family enzyme
MARAEMREFHRVPLIEGATPMQRADRLAVALGLSAGALYVKRDDLTALAGGGNKVRKLEYLCAAAQREGVDTLVTGGGPQSNHVRLTAATARRVGLRCAVVLSGPAPQALSGNLLVDALLGPEVTWTATGGLAAVEAQLACTAERVRARGERPYLIPIGGADAVGSQGYRLAATEIEHQLPGHGLFVVLTAAVTPTPVRPLDSARTSGSAASASAPSPMMSTSARVREPPESAGPPDPQLRSGMWSAAAALNQTTIRSGGGSWSFWSIW